MRNIGIIGTGSYLPELVWTNADLVARGVETTDEWVFERTGIRQRHIAAEDEATSDLAVQAALRALEVANVSADEIDLIVLATSSPDIIQPSTAAIVQGKLGAVNAAAFDVGAVCAGFVYAMVTAMGMMRGFAHYKKVLVIGAETYSRILDWNDRATCVFFGDGAGAVVLAETKAPGYISHFIMNDGTGAEVIKFPAGGSRLPASAQTLSDGLHAFQMDGRKVWDFAIEAFPDAVRKSCEFAGCHLQDIDMLISHQANINIIQKGMDALGLPMEKTHVTIRDTANTSGASIPIALDSAVKAGKLKKNDLLALVGFGGGLSWGSVLLKWTH
jgi:3-oxoacyl-[acyl-carrier-protein] synthase-3